MYVVLEAAAGGDAFKWLELAENCGKGGEVIMGGQRTALESPGFREAWLTKVLELRGKDAASSLKSFASALHDTQGFEAARDFVDSHPSLPERDKLIRAVASSNLSGGGAAKADWLVAVSSPESLAASTGELIKSWTAKDPAAAAVWLNATPPAAVWRDPALKAFAAAIAPHDTEAARTFADQITDTALRDQTLRSLKPETAAVSGKASAN